MDGRPQSRAGNDEGLRASTRRPNSQIDGGPPLRVDAVRCPGGQRGWLRGV